jgi:exoribonuclease R
VSNYTPTKLEVRSQYANDSFGSDEYLIAVAEFDRWLEAHNAEVVKETEERIIKLFAEIKNEPQRKQENWLHKVARTAFADAAIKVIKGEQK